jgi:dTDP-4-amino-4,6-dideoxygalactose transaminase
MMINIFEPNVGTESESILGEVFKSKWLGRGEYVSQFETQLCEYLKIERKNFHTLASCTDAIFAGLRVFDLPKGSKVVMPSNSFPAVPSAILEAGLEPLIIDIDPETGNLSLEALKKYFNAECSAVFVTDYGGIPNNIEAIKKIIGKDGVLFVDAAPSLGTFINGKFSGFGADFCCWSFDAMKLLVCGEGGGVYIKDHRIMEKFKEYTYLGLSATEKSGLDRSKDGDIWWEYDIKLAGSRSVFTNVNAAIGLPSVTQLNKKIERRQDIRTRYLNALENMEGISVLRQENTNISYSNYFFSVQTEQRNELAIFLKENGVYSTFRYFPTHRIPFFAKYSTDCTKCDIFSNTSLNIPIHESLSDDNVEKIISTIKDFMISINREVI